MKPMNVTSLDAARRQLATAIDLWADDRDPVSIHSLAFAAYQVIHDLNRLNKGPSMLLDNKMIAPEKRAEFVNVMKRDANFFKHADGRRKKKGNTSIPAEIEFDPSINELFIAIAIVGLQYLGQNLTALETAFYTWIRFQHPDLLTDAGRELFENRVPTDVATSLRSMKKREFLQRCTTLFSAHHDHS